MTSVTRQPPRMWGPAIVGFGQYRYKYESGREGDSCLTGFSSRKGPISVYLVASFSGRDALLQELGKHRMGKGCLYVRRLDDIDTAILKELVKGAGAEVKRRYIQE